MGTTVLERERKRSSAGVRLLLELHTGGPRAA